MRSVRLDPELDDLVRRAAVAEDVSVSEFIRRAAAERAHRTLEGGPSEQLADLLGAVRSSGGRAAQTGEVFTQLLADRRR